jgi:hypothetical protein
MTSTSSLSNIACNFSMVAKKSSTTLAPFH